MCRVLSEKHKVLIKSYSTAINVLKNFLAECYIVIGVIMKETICIEVVAVYV